MSGNWIRYAGTRARTPNFGVTMFGQILIGLAQPFVLAAPTRYSDLWFTPQGRLSATAAASLANPFGGALGQLINPMFVQDPSDIPDMILYIAIISSVATIPSMLIPSKPPTPVSASSNHPYVPIRLQISLLTGRTPFWLLLFPFAVYVGFFNSFSSLLTQFQTPYGFSETQSGIAGALLILVGLVAAAIISPIIGRSKRYILLIKILAPVIALCYLVFIWVPASRSVAASDIVCAVLGAASFSLMPVALEWIAEVTWPVGPEVGSVFCWAGGQALGGIFIIVSGAMKDGIGYPPNNYRKALIFQAVLALAAVPAALSLGIVGGKVPNRRLEVDKGIELELNRI
jgi:FLVCR family MFS transporter 7